jgi:hypothetical protein
MFAHSTKCDTKQEAGRKRIATNEHKERNCKGREGMSEAEAMSWRLDSSFS